MHKTIIIFAALIQTIGYLLFKTYAFPDNIFLSIKFLPVNNVCYAGGLADPIASASSRREINGLSSNSFNIF